MTLRFLDDRRCLFLTIAVAFSLIALPFLPDGDTLSAVMMLFYTTAMVGAPLAINEKAGLKYMKYLIAAWIFLFCAQLSGLLFFPEETLLAGGIRTGVDIVNLSFELFLVICVLYYSVKSSGRGEPVFGCILSYMLLATFFGNVFFFVLNRLPGSFASTDGALKLCHGDMIYFSFITLSTCGFGDIVPTHLFAKMLVSLETVCGVMYVALFIGRIISGSVKSEPSSDNA